MVKRIREADLFNADSFKLLAPMGKSEPETILQSYSEMSGLLIGGTTGSGKTSFVRSIITELIRNYSPQEVKFLIYDSKYVDYIVFNRIPHLVVPVGTEYRNASGMIHWLNSEADNRIQTYSEIKQKPFLFLILDDYAMVSDYEDVQEGLVRLLQLGRSIRICVWIITSTPSTNAISTDLKANIPARIAFHSTSKAISRLIIGENGAELLPIPGEIIFNDPNEMIRCRSWYLDESEIQDVVSEVLMRHPPVSYDEYIDKQISEILSKGTHTQQQSDSPYDEYIWEAGQFIIEKDKASIGLLQRFLKIGFNRAAHIMDQLCDLGVVGEEEGTKARSILMTMEEFEELQKQTRESD